MLLPAALSALVAALFMVWVGILVLGGRVPPAVLAAYALLSLLTFTVYAMDKSAARRGAWRVRESTLHLLSLSGGWPGALVAQQALRHKSSKISFLLAFLVTALLNCGALVWLLTPTGAAILRAVLAAVSDPKAASVLSG